LSEKHQILIRVPKDLHQRLKAVVSQSESKVYFQSLVIEALEDWLRKGKAAPEAVAAQSVAAANRAEQKLLRLRYLNPETAQNLDRIIANLLENEEAKRDAQSLETKTKAEKIAAWLAAPPTETDRELAAMVQKILQL
jgi:hypothetical protein